MDTTPDQALELKSGATAPDVIEGVIIDDPGTPCTPEYARELTEKALNLADELDGTMRQIVRVRAWVPLGYQDPHEYVLREFTQSSRAHRYRLARFAAFAHQLTERLGDDALELQLTERALRQVAPDRDSSVLKALESRLTDPDGEEDANEVLGRTLRAHARNAPPDEDMWDDESPAAGSPAGRTIRAASADDEDGWAERQDGGRSGLDDADVEPEAENLGAAGPPSKAALAEAQRYEEFLRAMRVIAAIGGELPGILDNAGESEEEELTALAQKVSAVAVATGEALLTSSPN
ncbi:hypothetical protein [Streptomyces niveus]|uniref:hypothetical protein n=1 Tax=Streptomyces niveus TaxID=193462 RepID=UPI00343B34B4